MVENFLERFSFRFFHIVSMINAPPCSVVTSRRTTFPISLSVAGSTRSPDPKTGPAFSGSVYPTVQKKRPWKRCYFAGLERLKCPLFIKKRLFQGVLHAREHNFPCRRKTGSPDWQTEPLQGPDGFRPSLRAHTRGCSVVYRS